MSTDRVLAILGVIIGLPAFFALFFSTEHRMEGALTAVLVVVVLLAAWWIRRQQEQPQFTSLELTKDFVLFAPDGSEATYRRTERMKANFNGITEWWSRNIIQDGTISDLMIDGHAPDIVVVESGTTAICKRFARPLEKGEEITISTGYKLHNAFPKPNEAVIHNNSVRVREVTISIELPKPCTQAEMRRTYNGDHGKVLGKPEVSAGNHKIVAKIKKPLMGASYHVEWVW